MTAVANSGKVKPVASDQVRFVSFSGNDSNDGFSWGSAKRTIQAGINALSSNPGVVEVGAGIFQEHVTISAPGLILRGRGGQNVGAGTTIQAPDNVTDCLTIGAYVQIENVLTCGFSTTWNAVGFNINHGSFSIFRNCRHQNGDNSASATTGGTAWQIENTEGCLFERCHIQECSLGWYFVNEATENVLIDCRGSANYRDLYMGGNAGGNTFIHMKTTACKSTVPNVVEIAGGGDNTFLVADWDEGVGPNNVVISSSRNKFIMGIVAPESVWTVSGNDNHFDHHRILNQIIVTGARNKFDRPRLAGNGTQLTDNGTFTEVNQEIVESGTFTGSASVLRRLRGQTAIAPPGSAGTLMRKQKVYGDDGRFMGYINLFTRGVSTYEDAVMADRPYHYWRFDETSGTTAVDVVELANGVHGAGVAVNQTGKENQACAYDASATARTDIPSISSRLFTSAFSVEFWIKRTSATLAGNGSEGTVIDAGSSCFEAKIQSGTNNPVLQVHNVGSVVVANTAITNDSTWHHVVLVYNGASSKGYVDGTDVTTGATSRTFGAPSNVWCIAQRTDATQRLNGQLDEVAVYDYALSSAQVAAHYAAA